MASVWEVERAVKTSAELVDHLAPRPPYRRGERASGAESGVGGQGGRGQVEE